MKKLHVVQRTGRAALLPVGTVLAACLALPHQGAAQIITFGPIATVNLPGAGLGGGFNASVTSEISFGNFPGIGLDFLYQYQIVNTSALGTPNMNAFNLITSGALAPAQATLLTGNAAPNNAQIAGAAVSLATAVPGNLGAASAVDNVPGGAAPGGAGIPAIPTTPAVALPFSTPGFVALAPVVGTASGGLGFAVYNFNQPVPANLQVINADAPLVAGGWEFTFWTDGAGDNLARWFSTAGGLAPGQTSPIFDIFSPFGPVPSGAFADPENVDGVDIAIDNTSGDTTEAPDPDVTVPEPATWSLFVMAAAGVGIWRRRLGIGPR